MRYLRYLDFALLALLLAPCTCHAGMAAKRMMAVMKGKCYTQTGTASTLNGISSVTESDTSDTGVATPSTLPLCSGTVSVNASCNGGTGGSYGSVYLKVNGVVVQSLSCAAATGTSNSTFTYPVSGRYSAQVFITTGGNGTAQADTFSFPVAQ